MNRVIKTKEIECEERVFKIGKRDGEGMKEKRGGGERGGGRSCRNPQVLRVL